jgi:hypothetical protein
VVTGSSSIEYFASSEKEDLLSGEERKKKAKHQLTVLMNLFLSGAN